MFRFDSRPKGLDDTANESQLSNIGGRSVRARHEAPKLICIEYWTYVS
jgi:hypothetical protein